MRTATSTRKSSFARLSRWLHVQARMVGVVLALMLAPVAAVPPSDANAAVDAARSTVADARHVLPRPSRTQASAAAALVPGSGQFGGLTSQGWPVVMRVSRRGDRVRQAVAGIELTCTSGDFVAVPDKWRNLPIRGRRFGDTATGMHAAGESVFQMTSAITGKVSRSGKRIAGTWRSQLIQRNAAGITVDTCDTGPLRFTIRR